MKRFFVVMSVVLLSGCAGMRGQPVAAWCTPGAEHGQPVEFIVVIDEGTKPTVTPDNCRVRGDTVLTWVASGDLAASFQGVEFMDRRTPDARGRMQIPVVSTGSGPQASLHTRAVAGSFPYWVLAGGTRHDPVVIVDPR